MPTPDVPILTFCDALVARIKAAWGPAAPDGVQRAYDLAVRADKIGPADGRQVYVFPDTYGNEPASRKEDLNSYHVAFLVVEKYPDQGPPLLEWADARVKFVLDTIVDGLDFSHDGPLVIGPRRVWTVGFDDLEVYDPGMLVRHKLFWCEPAALFREIA